MESNDRKLMQIKALLTNTIAMLLYLLTAVMALVAGLYFYFDMSGSVGFAIGVALYCLSGLIFLIGEIRYFVTMRRIKEDVYD
jgi:membrane protein YdbS with pleckstrin-like domain